MPVNIKNVIEKEEIKRCKECEHLCDQKEDALKGYQYKCDLLNDTAFNMIPDEIVNTRSVFPDCPKLQKDMQGSRYRVYKN